MLLCIDIGNTNIVLGLREGDKWSHIWRIHTDTRRTADEYAIMLRQLAQSNDIELDSVNRAISSSVVPYLTPTVSSAVKQTFGCDSLDITHETPLGFEIKYRNPAEVGPDRLVNTVSGKAKYGAPCIIVDLGTALTLDVISKVGDYEGGVIMPGIEMSADALFKKTARLPRITIKRPPTVLGRATNESIQTGLYWGIIYAVDGLIEALWKELGYETRVISTGGRGQELIGVTKHVTDYDENLTLDGLAILWGLLGD